MSKTIQYFEYFLDGKRRQFLLMPGEVEPLKQRIKVINLPAVFESFTGKVGASDVALVTEYLNTQGEVTAILKIRE